jgi:hypothetical protein
MVAACNNPNRNISKINLEKNDGTVKVLDKNTHKKLESVFDKVKWEPKAQVSMSRKEDCKLDVTYKVNSKSETVGYLIWFSKIGTAELVSSDQNESYGQLDKVHTKTLKEITEMNR